MELRAEEHGAVRAPDRHHRVPYRTEFQSCIPTDICPIQSSASREVALTSSRGGLSGLNIEEIRLGVRTVLSLSLSLAVSLPVSLSLTLTLSLSRILSLKSGGERERVCV